MARRELIASALAEGDLLRARGEDECAVFPAWEGGERQHPNRLDLRYAIEYAKFW